MIQALIQAEPRRLFQQPAPHRGVKVCTPPLGSQSLEDAPRGRRVRGPTLAETRGHVRLPHCKSEYSFFTHGRQRGSEDALTKTPAAPAAPKGKMSPIPTRRGWNGLCTMTLRAGWLETLFSFCRRRVKNAAACYRALTTAEKAPWKLPLGLHVSAKRNEKDHMLKKPTTPSRCPWATPEATGKCNTTYISPREEQTRFSPVSQIRINIDGQRFSTIPPTRFTSQAYLYIHIIPTASNHSRPLWNSVRTDWPRRLSVLVSVSPPYRGVSLRCETPDSKQFDPK